MGGVFHLRHRSSVGIQDQWRALPSLRIRSAGIELCNEKATWKPGSGLLTWMNLIYYEVFSPLFLINSFHFHISRCFSSNDPFRVHNLYKLSNTKFLISSLPGWRLELVLRRPLDFLFGSLNHCQLSGPHGEAVEGMSLLWDGWYCVCPKDLAIFWVCM